MAKTLHRDRQSRWNAIILALVLLGISTDRTQAGEPQYGWTRTWGGTGGSGNSCNTVAVSPDGSVFPAGFVSVPIDLDPTGGTDWHQDGGPFILKLTSDGSYSWGYTYQFAGGNAAISADSAGGVIATGIYQGTPDFDPTGGVDVAACNSGMYVTKLGGDGAYHWTVCWGGTGIIPNDLSVGSDDEIVIVGTFSWSNLDFDPGAGVDLHSASDSQDVFVMKLNSDNTFAWARTFGRADFFPGDYGYGVSVGHDGSVAVTGNFHNTVDFDPTSGVDFHTSNGDADLYVMKLNADGTYAWTRTIGGSAGYDSGTKTAVDSQGNILVGSHVFGTVDLDPTSGVDLRNTGGNSGGYVTKLAPDGSYIWTTSSSFGSDTQGVAVDQSDYILVTGIAGTYFVVMKLAPDGTQLWMREVGPSAPASATSYDIAVDTTGGVLVAGRFTGNVDFDPSDASDFHNGSQGIFVTKLIAPGIPALSRWGAYTLGFLLLLGGILFIRLRRVVRMP